MAIAPTLGARHRNPSHPDDGTHELDATGDVVWGGMSNRFDLESVDLAQLAEGLRRLSSEALVGEVVGRTVLRDAVVDLLGCSELEAENLVETMIGRRIIVRRQDLRSDGIVEWQIGGGTD